MTFGWVLLVIGVIALVVPRPVVFLATYWRGWMPARAGNPGATSAARIGACAVLVAGVTVLLTT